MNYSGKFQFSLFGDAPHSSVDVASQPLTQAGAVLVPDAHLLFSGDYKRAGLDLVLSKDGHDHVVADYFKGSARALKSPDGALLSPDLVKALVGEIQVAQLGGAAGAAQVIGHVTKMSGSATAIRNGVSILLNVGDAVQKGDVVQAGADSSLGLTFIDGTVFGLSANARMVLNEMVYDPQGSSNSSLLSLVQGTITFVAGETAKHGDMRVDTPVATMGIRGTAVLVEIGFEVPGQGGAPPVKFQVLAEPGGKVGSYVLYSKADPSLIIGTVNQAGQLTMVSGNGDTSTGQAPPLSPEAQAIIPQIFQLYFPTGNPTNPSGAGPGGGSAPANPNNGTAPAPLKFDPFKDLAPEVPRVVPINQPNAPPGTPPINVTLTRLNTAPVIESAKLTVTDGGTTVLGAENFGVVDPDNTSFTFKVSNVTHGTFEVFNGVIWVAATAFTTADLAAGNVRFVHDGSRAAPTFSVQADDGVIANNLSGVVAGSVDFATVNHAPVITKASLAVAEGGTTVLGAASFGIADPDNASFTFKVSNVSHGAFQVFNGVLWLAATTFTTADLNAGHVRFVHDGSETAPSFSIQADDGGAINHLSGVVAGAVEFASVNDAPLLTRVALTLVESGVVVLTAASISVADPDSSQFSFRISNVSHGVFQTSTDGIHWIVATTFTTADLLAGHVRFVHDGGEAAPTFSIQADDGAAIDHLSNVLAGAIDFTHVNDAPVITSASLAVAQGGTVIVQLSDVGISDPDSSSFVYAASGTHGFFEILVGSMWVTIPGGQPVTSADIAAGHVRFHHDGSSFAPEITVLVSDGSAVSAPFAAHVDFTPTPLPPDPLLHLTSSAGVSIDLGPGGATDGFVFPNGGNVTTPGTQEDRIVLGYHLGQNANPVIVNGSPLMHDNDFTPLAHMLVDNHDGSHSVVTSLGAGNGVTLTQTTTLGDDANYFTTTIDVANGSSGELTDVRFLRNFDPDQDVQMRGSYYTANDVIHNPTGADDVAIVSAKGAVSGMEVAMIGLHGDWRASSFGFTNRDPYTPQAYDTPSDPNGQQNDQAISLAYDFGRIAAGNHATTTFITTANVATSGSNALFGTDGADTINGLGGNDLLIGLGGADNFVFTSNSGRDTIYDFQKNFDHIDLSALSSTVTQGTLSTWMAQHVLESPDNASDTLITLDGGDTILLRNVAHTSLGTSDFIVHA